MINNASSITDRPEQDGWWRMHSEFLPITLDARANEPRATQCHVSGLACVTMHNIIRALYWTDHQGLADDEDNNHRQVPGV